MAFVSLKDFFDKMGLVSPDQFMELGKAWRVAEDVFLQKLAQALNWPFLEMSKLEVPAPARNKISTKVAFQHSVMPTDVMDGTVQIAVSNPFDTAMLNAVRFDARGPVQFALAPKAEIEKALKKYYGVGAETLEEMGGEEEESLELLIGDKEITEGDQEASVIKFVNQIIWEAYKDRATDIHLEPQEDEFRIRYRIDGILHQTPMPPQLKRFQAAIISRIKVMSGMNISEKRLPQDGRINVRIKGEEIDIRVST